MHLTFPKFIITADIPEDRDLRLPLQPLSIDDWSTPSFVCDGIELKYEHLNVFESKLHLLNNVLTGGVAMIVKNSDNFLNGQDHGRVMTHSQRNKEYKKAYLCAWW